VAGALFNTSAEVTCADSVSQQISIYEKDHDPWFNSGSNDRGISELLCDYDRTSGYDDHHDDHARNGRPTDVDDDHASNDDRHRVLNRVIAA